MYCINCGVKLSDGQTICPICKTPVYHPDIDIKKGTPTYPNIDTPPEEYNKKGIMFVITFIFLIPLTLSLICDLSLNHAVIWSGYVIGALIVTYVSLILPFWFAHPNPVIFVPSSFAACAVFLIYINFQTGGHWYLKFALPIVAVCAMITTAAVTLLRYIKRGHLYIYGSVCIATGLFTVLIEILANITFSLRDTLIWSAYPLIAFFIIGMMLIIVAIVKPFRESLHKMFFIK